MLAHPALYCRFNFMQEGRELASQQPMGTERNSKVFEGEATFRETRVLEDTLLHVVPNSTKINKRLPCINM